MIGFVHVPKTGGTSLRTAFEAAGHRVWRPRGPRYTSEIHRPDADVIAGHIPYDVMTTVDGLDLVTILRDPVERWVSHYYVEAGPWPRADDSRWPPVDVVPDNMLCRMLSAWDDPDPEQAAKNLARFTHVGRTDRLDDTFTALGLTPERQRVSGRPRGDRIPWWIREAGAECNPLDLELWEVIG